MMKTRIVSIRTSLLIIIALLGGIISIQSSYRVYESLEKYHRAQQLGEAIEPINDLFKALKLLSQERGASYASITAPNEQFPALLKEIAYQRTTTETLIKSALTQMTIDAPPELSLSIDYSENLHSTLQRLRSEFDRAVLGQSSAERQKIAENLFITMTEYIDALHRTMEIYSRPFLISNPSSTRQLRISHVIWGISEYAGREYALLGRMIAEDRYPTIQENKDLLNWQGRLQYGWEIANSTVLSNTWPKDVLSSMKEAEIHYLMTFEQVKDIFNQPSDKTREANYPISLEMWLEFASQAVDALYGMNDAVLKLNISYVENAKRDTTRGIALSLLLFACGIGACVYSWRFITSRVVEPVNELIETLYKATRGEAHDISSIPYVYRNDEIGKLAQVLALFQENAVQLQIERDKAQAANIAKDEFLANMSHEIRTPMNVVIGLSTILTRTAPLTPKQEELIKTLQLSAGALMAIINDLLDFSKLEARHFELEEIQFSLRALANEVVSLMSLKAREKGLAFTLDADGLSQDGFIGDPTRIRQILMNLCSNAIKFTSKGHVLLKMSCQPSETAGVYDIQIVVEDTGIGVPEHMKDMIFDKFTQADSSISRKFGGTGLGLAIVKTFTEMMGGSITVDSTVGVGTAFTLSLRLKLARKALPDTSAPTSDASIAEEKKDQNLRVLIVEDYQPNAMVMSNFLESFGFAFDIAENGRTAIEKAKKGGYHAILMDIQMPDVDGYQATTEIRKFEKENHLPPVRIIGVTAHALAADRSKCLKYGMNDYLPKPFNPEDLRKKLF